MTHIIDITLRPGCAIRKIRQEKGWTIKQLAEKSGVHHNQVARIELKNTGGWFTIVWILQALGVSISFDCQSGQLQTSNGQRNQRTIGGQDDGSSEAVRRGAYPLRRQQYPLR